MTAPLSPILASRLKKAAVDNGFDRELARQGDWLVYGSTQCPLTILARHPRRRGLPRRFLSAERCPCARRARNAHGSPAAAGCARRPHGHGPPGAPPAREPRTPAQQDVARRAPPHPRKAVRGIAEEHRYRAPRRPARRPGPVPRGPAGVLGRPVRNHRPGRPELLRTSHTKPWADCDTDAELLDVLNGLPLASHLDAAFDRGFITVADDGGPRSRARWTTLHGEHSGSVARFAWFASTIVTAAANRGIVPRSLGADECNLQLRGRAALFCAR